MMQQNLVQVPITNQEAYEMGKSEIQNRNFNIHSKEMIKEVRDVSAHYAQLNRQHIPNPMPYQSQQFYHPRYASNIRPPVQAPGPQHYNQGAYRPEPNHNAFIQ
jgi:hypothetical protein